MAERATATVTGEIFGPVEIREFRGRPIVTFPVWIEAAERRGITRPELATSTAVRVWIPGPMTPQARSLRKGGRVRVSGALLEPDPDTTDSEHLVAGEIVRL